MTSTALAFKTAARQLFGLGLLCTFFISGCGADLTQSAGAGSGGTGVLVAGLVADGYLEKATVFLDKNGNYQLDAGEPSAVTDVSGSYKLEMDPADVGRYPIVALVIKGVTVDRDTNQPVTGSYVLSVPKESVSGTVSTFISPISSQLREMMESGSYPTIQQASAALITQMGLPSGTNIMQDYLAANNTTLHGAAQNMASLMASQMDQILSSNGSTLLVDVPRYRAMMATIRGNMATVMGGNSQGGMANLKNSMSSMLGNMAKQTGM